MWGRPRPAVRYVRRVAASLYMRLKKLSVERVDSGSNLCEDQGVNKRGKRMRKFGEIRSDEYEAAEWLKALLKNRIETTQSADFASTENIQQLWRISNLIDMLEVFTDA